MSNVSLIDGHIDEPKNTNYERIRKINEKNIVRLVKWCDENCASCEEQSWNERCNGCPVDAVKKLIVHANIQKAEIEKLEKNDRYSTEIIWKQSTEIEKLQKSSEEAVNCFTRMESLYKIKCKELEVAKAEARKELVDRLKEEATVDDDMTWWLTNVDLDKVLKELEDKQNGLCKERTDT